MRNAYGILLLVLVCASYAIAAEEGKKDDKKEGPLQTILGMPLKVVEPIVGGKKGTETDTGKEAQKEPERKTVKDMTPAEICANMKTKLGYSEEILSFIPGLKRGEDTSGGAAYTFQGSAIEDLDRDTLEKLYSRVSNEFIRIRADRFNRQMNMLRRTQNAADLNRKHRNYNVPKTPQVPRLPPRTPAIPKSPPKLPKTK